MSLMFSERILEDNTADRSLIGGNLVRKILSEKAFWSHGCPLSD